MLSPKQFPLSHAGESKGGAETPSFNRNFYFAEPYAFFLFSGDGPIKMAR